MTKLLHSIRNKLLVAFAAVVTIPLVLVAIYSTRSTVGALDEAALGGAADGAEEVARRVDRVLHAARLSVEESAGSAWLKAFVGNEPGAPGHAQLRAKAEYQAVTLMRTNLACVRVEVIDEEGRVVLREDLSEGGGAPPGPNSVADRRHFREGLALFPGKVGATLEGDEIIFVSRLVEERFRGRGVFAMALSRSALLGAIGIEKEARDRFQVLRIDASGEGRAAGPQERPLDEDEMDIIRSGRSGAFHAPEGMVLAFAGLSPASQDPGRWVLVREVPAEDLTGPVRSYRLVFTAVIGGALALALLLSVILSRQLTGPIETLGRGARRMGGGDLATELDVRSDDELQDLADEFNGMARQLRDLTEGLERKVEEKVAERERLEVQLLQSERLSSIGLLAAGVAHEVHNPLATISMYAQMLLEKTEDDVQKEKLGVILEHIDRISQITRGLLDFSRRTDGELRPVDLHDALDATLRLVAPELSRQNVRAEFDRADRLPLVRGEEKQLQQVFLNILMNAAQAMPDGGTVRIATRRLGRRGMAEVQIRDEGTGIDEETLGKIFDPFFTTKEPGQGTGLGMAVTYGIVQSHRGTIDVESKVGKGTTVTIRLPFDGKERGK